MIQDSYVVVLYLFIQPLHHTQYTYACGAERSNTQLHVQFDATITPPYMSTPATPPDPSPVARPHPTFSPSIRDAISPIPPIAQPNPTFFPRKLLFKEDFQNKMVLEAIRYTRGSLSILDQLLLPHQTHYDPIYSSTDAWHAIRSMRTRGAPAIAIVAALGLAVELTNMKISAIAEEVEVFILEKLEYLVTSRPTAVNLADAAGKLKKKVVEEKGREGATGESVREVYVKAAERMLVDDVRDNEAIGDHGAEWIIKKTEEGARGALSVLTHCNTG